ncbi:ABC transporter substrate-binding protein [Rhodoferax sp.]|uniref:ABC transporter substrate-binding protein n=1 Tax=Rhodoferax sp. TaxID=50421 RepID=UPI00277A560D|nr:ABC transporter substrate-binding protein [Rhodoferax sp.]
MARWSWLLVLAAGLATAQDQKMVRIGVTKIVSHAALDADEKGFEAALASAGFKEGVNVRYDRQNAQGDLEKARAIAEKFEKDKVDLVHSIATPTSQAVVKAIRKIPVVFSSISDPVDAGVVPKDSAPGKKTGSNVTGVSDMWPVQLQMETYAKFVPKAKSWGTIFNPAEANSVTHVKAMREAAKALGLQLLEVTVAKSSEVEQAAASLVGKVQAIAITSDNTTVANIAAIARVCDKHKIALFAGDVDSVPRGAIAAYGMDYFLVGYAAGKKAALVLKGVKPGDIPWGPVEKFSLVINQKAAKAQGVTVSPDLLKKADKVLE